jgi:hypothetical protein
MHFSNKSLTDYEFSAKIRVITACGKRFIDIQILQDPAPVVNIGIYDIEPACGLYFIRQKSY